MCDQDHFEDDRRQFEALGQVTRRQFGVIVAAGVAMALPAVANAANVAEADVTVTTPDGQADAYFVHPSSGVAAGVLVWPDIFGLRPAFRQMGKRLAESGYSVLVVNPFYRVKKAPTSDNGTQTPIADLRPLAQALSETTQMTDAKAFIAWLDQQPSVSTTRKIGTQGYCMGGRRGGLVPRWRPGHGRSEQPASSGGDVEGAVSGRDRRQRRSAFTDRQGRAQGHVRESQPAG